MTIDLLNGLPDKKPRMAVRERLRWIDGALTWDGQFNRSDLMARFGVSLAQVSVDVAIYNEISGTGALFSHKRKVFTPKPGFVPVFHVALEEWLRVKSRECGDSKLVSVPRLDGHRDNSIIRQLLGSMKRSRPCDVAYFSAPRNSEQRATFCPHSFFSDGGPLYIRGWNASRGTFMDICVPHITEAKDSSGSVWIPEHADVCWSRLVKVGFTVNPALDRTQQVLAEMECGMRDGARTIEMRHALLPHVLRRLGLFEAAWGGQAGTESAAFSLVSPADVRALLEQLTVD